MIKASEMTAAMRLRILCLGIAMLINIGAIGTAFYYQQHVHNLTAWVLRTRSVLKTLGETRNFLVDAEAGQRAYALTHNQAFVAPYDRAVAGIPAKFATLKQIMADNPTQLAALDNLEKLEQSELKLLGAWRDDIAGGHIDAETITGYANDSDQLIDQIRDLVTSMSDQDLYGQRLAESENIAARAQLLLLIGGSFSVVLIAATFFFMQRDMLIRRRSEESLSVTLSSIGDGVIATDNDAIVTRFNRAAEQMTGWIESDALGRPISEVFEIINEYTRAPATIPVTEVLKTGKIVGLANHTVLIARNGHELAIADSCAPIQGKGDHPLGTVLVFRDVTEERDADSKIRQLNETLEKRVEERTAALRESEERFSAFMDASPVIAWVKDAQGRYTYMNAACTRVFGLQSNDWMGKTEFDLIAADLAESWRGNDREVLSTGMPLEATETLIGRDGQQLSLKSIKFPFRGINGEICVGGVAIDITRQLRTENQLRQAQKMEAVGQLTGGLAHDFNNLLAVMIGNLDYVAEELPPETDAHAAANEALTAALRGAELTKQLLSFSRQQTLQPKLLVITPLIEELTKLLKRTLGEAVTIRLQLAPNLWSTKADPSMLESALMNLAVNARDAMSNGGTLTIKVDNCHLDEDYIALNPEMSVGDYVRLSVSDTGSGMPPEVIARAFDPFFTTKAVGHGTGLGLSMVHGFAKQSGGNVKIYSELGHGTTISLYLPRALREGDIASTEKPTITLNGAGETILVVEDNSAVLKLVEKQLIELGYQVLTAPDGPSAMKILNNGVDIDLLFTDVVMPGGMSGPDVAREARRLKPELRVLFSSGFPRDGGSNIGHDFEESLLSKPYRRADLAHKLREVLDAGDK